MAQGCTFTAQAIHHRRARGAGGTRRPDTNLPSNALYVCDACHRRIESQRTEALAAGWLVPQNGLPAAVPVMYRGQWTQLENNNEKGSK